MTNPTPILVGPLRDDAGNPYWEIAVPMTQPVPGGIGTVITLARAVSGPDGTIILPAKDDTLQSVLTAIQALTSQDAGLATDAHLTTLTADVVSGLAPLSTADKQDTGNTALAAIAASLSGTLTVGLPSGAATAAKQDTGNTTLGSILTKLGSVVLGAGSAVIGGVTQSGAWVLSAGSAVIGMIAPQTGALQDASNTATTSDAAVAGAAPTKYLLLQHADTTGQIAFNFGAAAAINGAGSITLQPGQIVTMEGSFVATNALRVIGSAAGLKFTVKFA